MCDLRLNYIFCMFLDRLGLKSDSVGRFVGSKEGLQLPHLPLNPRPGECRFCSKAESWPLQDTLKVIDNKNSNKFQNILIDWPAQAGVFQLVLVLHPYFIT